MVLNKKHLATLLLILLLLGSFNKAQAFSFKQFFNNIFGVNKVQTVQPASVIDYSTTDTSPAISDTLIKTNETVIETSDTPIKETSIVLKYGMKNSTNVQIVQKRLKTLGYFAVNTDGNYGKITVSSVANFQKDNGINEDGTIIGPLTLEALNLTLSKDITTKNTITDTTNFKILTSPTKPTSCSSYQYISQWGTYGIGKGQFIEPRGIATDSTDNVYVTDSTNRVQKFTSNGAYITQWGTSGSGNGQFNLPFGIGIDSNDSVYITDTNNNRIQKFTSNGTYITGWGTYGTGNGQFRSPHGVVTDSTGSVYITDTNNNRIQKFTSNGTYITGWGTYGTGNGQFSVPIFIATDSSDSVYATDLANNRVQKFTSDGTYITKWGGPFGSGNGQFNYPYGIATDSTSDVYVTELNNNRVQKFTSDGTYITKWGGPGSGNSEFQSPIGIATDSIGNVYVVDSSNSRVQKFGCTTPPPPPVCTINSFTVPTSTTLASGLSVTTSWSSNCNSVVLQANSGSYTQRHVGGSSGTYTFIGGSGTSLSNADSNIDITMIAGNSTDTISQTKSVPISDVSSPASNQCAFSSLTASPNPVPTGSNRSTLSWVTPSECKVYVNEWKTNVNGSLFVTNIFKPITYYFDSTDSVNVNIDKSSTYYLSAQQGGGKSTVLTAKTIDVKKQ